jgi:hypothetical protein
MRKSKYTKELLQPIVESNVSLAGVIKELGLKLTGSNYGHIRQRIDKVELGRNLSSERRRQASRSLPASSGIGRIWQTL